MTVLVCIDLQTDSYSPRNPPTGRLWTILLCRPTDTFPQSQTYRVTPTVPENPQQKAVDCSGVYTYRLTPTVPGETQREGCGLFCCLDLLAHSHSPRKNPTGRLWTALLSRPTCSLRQSQPKTPNGKAVDCSAVQTYRLTPTVPERKRKKTQREGSGLFWCVTYRLTHIMPGKPQQEAVNCSAM